MLSAIVRALEKTGNINRSAYTWNAINACLSAAQCPVIVMVMTRTNGVVDTGVFSIAFAVATLMLYVGQYGLRRFQSSDLREKYTFMEYHGMRFITCGIMIAASLAYGAYGIIFRDYSTVKFLVVFMVCLLKVVQAYADVIHGHMQQRGRLDVATKASSSRYLLEIVACCVTLILTHNLILAMGVTLVVSVVGLLLTSVNAARNYCASMKPTFPGYKIRRLFIDGFPLFISLFLNMYISNAPKYAIDAHLTDEIQTYFNVLFMPAFMIQLIAHFIFNPILTTYAKLWLSGKKEDLRRLGRLIRNQCFVVLGLTALAVAVAATIGIPVLEIIFGVDLQGMKKELCILMVGGGMMAYSVYFSTVITVIRKQQYLLISYGIVALAAKVLAGWFVSNQGISGAVLFYAVLMAVLSVMLFVIMIAGLRKGNQDEASSSSEENGST